MLGRADVIVRAMALDYVGPLTTSRWGGGYPIAFRVIETLKGNVSAQTLVIIGGLSEQDDFNDHPVPYTFVRRGGRGGNCFAMGYQKGSTYLLLLKVEDGSLTPYWSPLAPVNEQLRSSEDPWLLWVRGRLKAVP